MEIQGVGMVSAVVLRDETCEFILDYFHPLRRQRLFGLFCHSISNMI